MAGQDRRDIGRLFDEVPALYDRVRPAYPPTNCSLTL